MDLSGNENKFSKDLEAFNRALSLFHQVNERYKQDQNDPTNQMALAHAFMLSVELSWKMLHYLIRANGDIGGHTPKTTILKAGDQGVIESAEDWVEALRNRNRTVHIYDPGIADQALRFAHHNFPGMINDLAHKLNLEIGQEQDATASN